MTDLAAVAAGPRGLRSTRGAQARRARRSAARPRAPRRGDGAARRIRDRASAPPPRRACPGIDRSGGPRAGASARSASLRSWSAICSARCERSRRRRSKIASKSDLRPSPARSLLGDARRAGGGGDDPRCARSPARARTASRGGALIESGSPCEGSARRKAQAPSTAPAAELPRCWQRSSARRDQPLRRRVSVRDGVRGQSRSPTSRR